MKSKEELQKKILLLTPEFEAAEESYFSAIEEKQSGGEIYESDFIKIESEYELIKKEIDTLEWVLNIDNNE